jgi:hypothetical protein
MSTTVLHIRVHIPRENFRGADSIHHPQAIERSLLRIGRTYLHAAAAPRIYMFTGKTGGQFGYSDGPQEDGTFERRWRG